MAKYVYYVLIGKGAPETSIYLDAWNRGHAPGEQS